MEDGPIQSFDYYVLDLHNEQIRRNPDLEKVATVLGDAFSGVLLATCNACATR